MYSVSAMDHFKLLSPPFLMTSTTKQMRLNAEAGGEFKVDSLKTPRLSIATGWMI